MSFSVLGPSSVKTWEGARGQERSLMFSFFLFQPAVLAFLYCERCTTEK